MFYHTTNHRTTVATNVPYYIIEKLSDPSITQHFYVVNITIINIQKLPAIFDLQLNDDERAHFHVKGKDIWLNNGRWINNNGDANKNNRMSISDSDPLLFAMDSEITLFSKIKNNSQLRMNMIFSKINATSTNVKVAKNYAQQSNEELNKVGASAMSIRKYNRYRFL